MESNTVASNVGDPQRTEHSTMWRSALGLFSASRDGVAENILPRGTVWLGTDDSEIVDSPIVKTTLEIACKRNSMSVFWELQSTC